MSPENISEYQLGMASNELIILYDCAMSKQLAIMSDEEFISGISVKMGYAEIKKTWRDGENLRSDLDSAPQNWSILL